MKSEKINLNKKIKLLWIVLLGVLLLSILITIIPYSKYKKGQDLAVASTLIATDEFDEYKDNKKELVKKIYDYFDVQYFSFNTKYGNINNSAAIESMNKAEESLREILRNEGYTEGYSATHYFKYTNYFSYYIYKDFIFLVLFAIVCGIYFLLNVFYFFSKKVEITINDNTINYKKFNGKEKQARIKDITNVETTNLKGIKITGNGIKYKTLLVKNNNELKDYIMKLIL